MRTKKKVRKLIEIVRDAIYLIKNKESNEHLFNEKMWDYYNALEELK